MDDKERVIQLHKECRAESWWPSTDSKYGGLADDYLEYAKAVDNGDWPEALKLLRHIRAIANMLMRKSND